MTDERLVRPDWVRGSPRSPGLLWLDKNENTDPVLLSFTRRILAELDPLSLCSYPECAPLYSKLGASLGLPPDHLLLTAGSDGAIRHVFEAYVNPGDAVLLTAPTFAMYPVYSAMYGARAAILAYKPSASGPKLDVEEVLDAVARIRPRLVCLPNPDSPTGAVFSAEDMAAIVRASGEAGSVLLVDEAYHPFHEDTIIDWIGRRKHLIVARTFAKAWGLAGLRIGYAAACPEVARTLHKVRPMYEVNTLAAAFMDRMLDHAGEMTASVARLDEGKRHFLASMGKLGLRTLPSRGNFLHVAFGRHAAAVFRALEDKVLFRKGFEEPCLAGFSRFTSTTKELFLPVICSIERAVSPAGRASA